MSSRRPKIQLHPINWVQRIALYVTQTRYYLVGSNNTQTAFKVLKIDRTEDDLTITDDRVEYTYQEIHDLIIRINHGNHTKLNNVGVTKTVSSFGLLGFVRFLHGYYLILIIKRRKVASLGYHTIYKVEDTKLVYIPNEQPKTFVSEEARYVRAFTNIGLSSNFYFSYSYDITRSLQYNLSPVRGTKLFEDIRTQSRQPQGDEAKNDADGGDTVERLESFRRSTNNHPLLLVKTIPSSRFVWNSHLLNFEGLHDDWKIHLMHGFVAQANICVYGKPIYVTLIARRSRCFCGTRFLKRGINMDGDVANEVETEQIVHDASISDFSQGLYTSFVQVRGSVPDKWSQDTTKIVAKPQITHDFIDPFHLDTAKHFDDLLRRYGSPIVVLSLVKKKEKRPQESILNTMLSTSISYLNQFLPQQHIIRLIAFDMARSNKSRSKDVMQRLEKIGFNIVRVTGIFQSWRSARVSRFDRKYALNLRQRNFTRQPSSVQLGGYRLRSGQCLQNGVVRVNCVDCLDRTNTAQFVLGKVALAFQLQAIGVLREPLLDYDTDAVRLLEQLYEDHGDTIALQYGGSQLVHRIKTYRKVAPLTSQSSEIMQTLSRYYSNTFSDAEKQNVMNLFLGVRVASPYTPATIGQTIGLNNSVFDYYLHNQRLLQPFRSTTHRLASYSKWWDIKYLRSLPRAHDEYEKESTCYALEVRDNLEQRVDYYFDSYRPFEISYLTNLLALQILNTTRDYMPSGSTDYSPFCLRLQPGKIQEIHLRLQDNRLKKLPPNPSVYGVCPSSSSSDSELSLMNSDDDDEDESEANSDGDMNISSSSVLTGSSFMMPSERRYGNSFDRLYNSQIEQPLKQDYALVKYLSEDMSSSVDFSTSSRSVSKQYHYDSPTTSIEPRTLHVYRSYLAYGSLSVDEFRDRRRSVDNFEPSTSTVSFIGTDQVNFSPSTSYVIARSSSLATSNLQHQQQQSGSSYTDQFEIQGDTLLTRKLSRADLTNFGNYVNCHLVRAA